MCAPLGELFRVAVGAVDIVILRGELLSSQLIATVRTEEAFLVPRLTLVGDSTLVDNLENEGRTRLLGTCFTNCLH